MKRPLILLILFSAISISAQEKVKVTLEIISPTLDDSAKIYVAGNIEELGNWNPSKVMLDNRNNRSWRKTIEVIKGTRLEYKFTKGSWATEALGSDSFVPQNSVLIANNDTTVLKTILNWRDKFNFKVAGQITGKVESYKNFTIEGLKPRDIIIWLPPNYERESDKRYPVLYMHDAQNIFDPRTSNTFIDWQADETADSLIRNNEIEPIIIVGLNNTDDRSVEYSDTPLGHLYMNLIIEKVKPFVDSKYRTLPERNNTAVGGSSMGGLISMMCAWEHPEVFSKAACFSPAFKISGIDYVEKILKYDGPKKNIMLYIDNGGVGLEAQLQTGVDEMISALKEKKYEEEIDFFVFIDKTASHNEAAWAKRVWRPLEIFFGK